MPFVTESTGEENANLYKRGVSEGSHGELLDASELLTWPTPSLPSRPALLLGVEGQQEHLTGPGDGALDGGVGRAFSRGDERLREFCHGD